MLLWWAEAGLVRAMAASARKTAIIAGSCGEAGGSAASTGSLEPGNVEDFGRGRDAKSN